MPNRLRATVAIALSVCLALALGGCAKPAPKVEPKVSPPVIGEAGLLRVGVDFSAPPYAGKDAGQDAGIDVDVASAIAGKLGLQVKLVDVKPDQAAEALKSGKVDVVLSVPLTSSQLAGATIAGTYIGDAPALFGKVETTGSVEPSLTVGSIGSAKIGSQKGSEAYWLLAEEMGEDAITAYPTLREAFQGATNGDATYVAGDAITGSYIARDFPGWRVVGLVGPATRIGAAVSPQNAQLAKTMRTTLDGLAADGVLDTISGKWVGQLPKLGAGTGTVAP